MKLTATVKRITESDSATEFQDIAKQIIYQMISFLGGVLFASINDFGTFSPFGVAYVTAVGNKMLISASLGAAAGYILTQDSVSALRYIAALVSAAVLTRLFDEFEKIKKFRLLPSCISFLTCFLTSLVVLFARDVEWRSFLLFLGEAALSFAAAYFFSSSRGALLSYNEQGGFTIRDLCVLAVSVNLLLMSVSGITIIGVSFSRIAAVMIVLMLSYIFKETGGAVTGITATLIFSMDGAVGAVGMAYAVAGLMCGAFAYMNRFVCGAVFLISFGVSFLFGEGVVENIYLIVEAVLAAVVFMSLPEKYIRKVEKLITIKKEPQPSVTQRQVILNRLKSASVAVGEMSQSVNAAAGVLKQTDVNDTMCVYTKVQDSVCDGCRLYDFCWDKNFKDCRASFDAMNEILKNNDVINQQNVPQYLQGCCTRLSQLTDCFNKSYINYVAALSAQDKIEKIRQVTGEQFGGICSMLAELSEEFADGITFDNNRAQRIEEMLLNEFSLKVHSVVCLTDTDSKLKIEIKLNEKPKQIKDHDLKEELQLICSRKLDLPVISESDNTVTLCFCEKTRYKVAAAATRITADNERLCGDSYESFYDGRGNYVVVLSDGMGTGMRAAVDSSLACGMMAKLLRSGFSYGSSLRLVNSALLLKSKDESLSTLDIMSINLYTGEACFYKAGAAMSYIKHKSNISEVRLASMPVGILKETGFAEEKGRLYAGDLAVVASDGAFEYTDGAVRKSLAVTLNESVEYISQFIAAKAKRSKSNRRCDDITVIAIRLLDNE